MDLQISRQAAIPALWLTLLLLVVRIEYGSTKAMTPIEEQDCICTKRTMTAGMLAADSIHYICCDVLEQIDTSCDSETYVSDPGSPATPLDLCESGGMDEGDGIRPFVIPCGNCDVQTTCASRCNLPGYPRGCSLWTKCFAKCCMAALNRFATTVTEVNALTFCGNGVCDAGESGFCIEDCCSGNPANCLIQPCIFTVPTGNCEVVCPQD